MDQEAARELKLFTENDADIYRQRTTPIVRNLRTKQAQGRYDHELAVKLFMYLAEAGARKYAREHGSGEQDWSMMFPKDVRLAVSREWRDEFETESALGNYDNETYLPKKYLGKKQASNLPPVGTRVQLHPATDAWMRGDRYGVVVKGRGTNKVKVKLDKSGRTGYFAPDYLIPLSEGHF